MIVVWEKNETEGTLVGVRQGRGTKETDSFIRQLPTTTICLFKPHGS